MTDSKPAPRTDPLTPPVPPSPPTGRKAPVPKQKRPGPYRVPPRGQRHGLLIVNTGDGKGKTTAALGLLLRATGRGMRAGMFQFVKRGNDGGEHRSAQTLGVDIIPLGNGCTTGGPRTDDDIAFARAGWARCSALLASGEYDVLILDELTLPLDWGWLDADAVIQSLRDRVPGTHVVVTGRRAPQALIDAADLVTDMRVVKHPLREQGIRAQAGIDV
jgi:cob(I)alamin adenosyltransferase